MPRRIPGTDNRVLRVCALLNKRRVRYLIAGGVAANLHGAVRATKDVGVLVPAGLANIERLLAALVELPWRVAAELDAADLVTKPVTIVGNDPRVDVLTVAWTVRFEDAWQTGRPSDLADLDALRHVK